MLAESYGIKAAKLEKTSQFESELKELLEHPGPTLIDVVVTEDENCYPMVAPGKSNSQMIGVFKRDLQDAGYLNSQKVGRVGFEPTQAKPADLQSAPFNPSGIDPLMN